MGNVQDINIYNCNLTSSESFRCIFNIFYPVDEGSWVDFYPPCPHGVADQKDYRFNIIPLEIFGEIYPNLRRETASVEILPVFVGTCAPRTAV
jgi:hypothetical protein